MDNKIGDRILEARNRRNLTQEELAERVGSVASYISNIERKNKLPSLTLLRKLVKELEIQGHEVVDTIFEGEMPIGRAVRASCSYPIVFSPCLYRDTKLIDGGIRENVPWKELKQIGADKIISVTFEEDIDKTCCKNLIEVGGRAIGLLSRELSNYEMQGSDYNLKLKSEKVGLLDMSKIDDLYLIGYNEMKNYLENNKITNK